MSSPRTVKRNTQVKPDPVAEQMRQQMLDEIPADMKADPKVNVDALLLMTSQERARSITEWVRRNARATDGTEEAIRTAITPTEEPTPDPESSHSATPPHSDIPTLRQSTTPPLTVVPALPDDDGAELTEPEQAEDQGEKPTQAVKSARRPAQPRATARKKTAGLPDTRELLEDLSSRWAIGSENMARLDFFGDPDLLAAFRDLRLRVFVEHHAKLNKSKVICRAVEHWLATHSTVEDLPSLQGTAYLSVRIPADVRMALDVYLMEQNTPVPHTRLACAALAEYLTLAEAALLPAKPEDSSVPR